MNDLNTLPFVSNATAQPKALASQEVACDHCGMYGMCGEAGLSRDTQMLEQVVSRRTPLARHSPLFSAGEPFQYLYALKSGSLAAKVEDGKGGSRIVGFYFPGDLLGLDAIEDRHYHTTVVAMEKSSVCKLDYDSVPLLGEHQGSFYRELIQAMSNRMMFERWTSLLLGTQSTEQRVAAFMLYFSSQLKVRGLPHLEFRLPMTRRDIADYLGLAMETVSRALSGLQKKGVLATKGRSTQISSLQGLHKLAELTPELTALSLVSRED
ncbi:MAG: helix-turn-helix domain-containing protein [Pseudomonadota bacterium]